MAGALPWFLLRDGQILSYQRGAEADKRVKEGDGQTQRVREGENKGKCGSRSYLQITDKSAGSSDILG